jgi:hypothetical protein
MGIYNFKNQVLQAANEEGIKVEVLKPIQMDAIRTQVMTKFVSNEGRKKLFFGKIY